MKLVDTNDKQVKGNEELLMGNVILFSLKHLKYLLIKQI